MATLFYGHHGHPFWAGFEGVPRHRRRCGPPMPMGRRCHARFDPRPPTVPPVPEDFLTTAAALAEAFLPTYLEAVSGATKKDETKAKKNAFEVKLDVKEFSPEELDVKTVDNTIVVEGKQAERQDELGYVSKSFVRRFVIPEGVKPDAVTCKLTSDGFLMLTAPVVEEPASERSIPITLSPSPAPQQTETENKVSNEAEKSVNQDEEMVDPPPMSTTEEPLAMTE